MRTRFFILAFLLVTLVFSADAFAAKRWRIAGVAPVEHGSTKNLQKTVKEINEKTDNKFRLKAYPANQLGDYTLLINEVAQGAIELGDISITPQLDKRLAIGYIPGLTATYEDMDYIYTRGSNYYEIYDELLAQHNIKLLGISVQGFVGVGMVKKPKSPKDITVSKDTMIRVPPIEAHKLAAEALNFKTVTINWGDLYPAMQTGVCDGWIGGTPSWNYIAFKDLLKYYIPYNVIVDLQAYIMNMDKWKSLSPGDQKIFQEAFTQAASRARKMTKESDADFIRKMDAEGIEIISFSDEEKREVAEQVRAKVWPAMEGILGKDIMERLKKDIQ